MKIEVNGDMLDVDARTLDEALEVLGFGEARVATAVNGAFVPAAARTLTQLAPGDRIEVLAPMQGG
jgi:sulfur carrier protein